MKEIIYWQPTMDDIDKLCELEKNVWGEEMGANREKWKSRLNIFPEGLQVATIKGELIGVVVTHLIDWNFPKGIFPSWAEATADGYLSNHSDEGNIIYGDDITVLPGNSGVASQLLQFTFDLMHSRGMSKGIMGSRIPSLARKAEKLKPAIINNEWVLRIGSKDREVNFFLRNGFTIIGVKEQYFPEDEASLGWGMILKVV